MGQRFTIELLIGPGPSAYSDMTLIDKDDIGILWEGGKENRHEKVIFTRIPKKVILGLDLQSVVNRIVY